MPLRLVQRAGVVSVLLKHRALRRGLALILGQFLPVAARLVKHIFNVVATCALLVSAKYIHTRFVVGVLLNQHTRFTKQVSS